MSPNSEHRYGWPCTIHHRTLLAAEISLELFPNPSYERFANRKSVSTYPAMNAASTDEPAIEQLLSREPTPEIAAQVADEFERLLDCLEDDSLRSVALRKMEGYTDEEIAIQLGCARRTVVRKLRRIRGLWGKEMA